MNNNKGFTLTEILLAAMIVGVIGVALAAITTAGVREGKNGRTKAMLRNQLSTVLRTLRQDIDRADKVIWESDQKLTLQTEHPLGPLELDNPQTRAVTYEFVLGTINSGGGKTGGTLNRQGSPILYNVKSISDEGFVSPSFTLLYQGTENYTAVSSVLQVRIIVEVPGSPLVNEVVDETFLLPQGIPIRKEPLGA